MSDGVIKANKRWPNQRNGKSLRLGVIWAKNGNCCYLAYASGLVYRIHPDSFTWQTLLQRRFLRTINK